MFVFITVFSDEDNLWLQYPETACYIPIFTKLHTVVVEKDRERNRVRILHRTWRQPETGPLEVRQEPSIWFSLSTSIQPLRG